MKNVVLPTKLNKFSWKYVVEKHPYAEVSLEDFKRLAVASDGWRFVQDSGFKYSIASGFHHMDEYVREALWHHDPDTYESLKGFSKVPRLGRAYHSLLKYCGPTVYKTNVFDDKMTAIYNENLNELCANFRSVSIIPLEIAATKVPTNTSAGVSFPGKKKGEVMDEAMANVRVMIETWKRGEQCEQIPHKLALRGHLSPKDQNKTRCVWVAPIEHTLLENMFFRGFYYQIFAGLHHQRRFMTGKDTIIRLNTYLAERPECSFVNTDISGWDSLRCRFVIQDIFHKVLRPNMLLEEPWHELAFEYLLESFIFSHLVLPDGAVFKKLGGVPSGSFLTLLVNSLGVWNVCTSALKYLDKNFYDERILGDDFCFKTDRLDQVDLDFSVAELSECVLHFYNLTIKPEKVVATNVLDDRKFIGYQIRKGRLFREDRELLCGMLYPESPVKSLAISFTRVFAYMIIGGFGSDKVTQFYERYLGGYYHELCLFGPELFRQEVMKSGNLRVFKHVFKVDLEAFDNFDIDSFRNLFSAKVPFFLTLGASFFLS